MQIDDTTASSLSTPMDATASTIAGGQAYMADMARRLALFRPLAVPRPGPGVSARLAQ